MDESGFRKYLKRGGRSASAVERCLKYVIDFKDFLKQTKSPKQLDEAGTTELEAFVESLESAPGVSAKLHLWGLRYYFAFRGNQSMADLAAELRQQRIKRTPFALGSFRGINAEHAAALAGAGIKDVKQMLHRGRTAAQRRALAAETGVPATAILEFVKLSDLARVPGLKGIRARLYHDAGVDTVEKLAARNAAELRSMLIAFVEETGFDGIAPLPGETEHAVVTAKELPKIVVYE